MPKPQRIVILTGAGTSAESGLPTFRDSNGLWENHRIEDVASPEGFARNPRLVQRFYNMRRLALKTVEPNASHLAVAELQHRLPGQITLITQNVDDLHERAGSAEVIHMHGELKKIRCEDCGDVQPWEWDVTPSFECGQCHSIGTVRPHIVWFGEMPLHMVRIDEALEACTLFAAIGTSGNVYPAAGFVHTAKSQGARCVEFNVAKTDISRSFDEHIVGPASVEVPKWVEKVLGEQ